MISLAALTVLDAGPVQQVYAAAAAGFGGVGLRLHPLLPTDPHVAADPVLQEALIEALRKTGLAVAEIGVFPILPGMDIEALAPVLSLSHKIGARFITCPVEDADIARRAETFARLCDLAETCGLDALIEFNPYSGCRNLEEARMLVEEAGRANARLLIDVLHLSRSGGKPADLLKVDPDLIALVHLCDAPLPPAQSASVDEMRRESRHRAHVSRRRPAVARRTAGHPPGGRSAQRRGAFRTPRSSDGRGARESGFRGDAQTAAAARAQRLTHCNSATPL